ncbi:PAS domain S-box protein [Lichenibacterium minor]|jgi:PAS domain S-box-containing protein|uniref:histidine kinase n=1 Tax=Lichenibacterium minor TaxID=2316528 RepID=A0A4Q2UDD7_9HYPH|nr:PAS domain-containing protein [Lichenibacterium minor]RYC33311.1 PAS domain S-box protein [Lichenibacterium minor]
MICVKDASMNVLHLSPEWADFTGRDIASSRGRGWLDAVHAEDRPTVDRTLEEASRARRGCSLRFRLLHRSGAGVWVSDDAVASFSPEDRTFLGLLGSITEIPADRAPLAAEGRVGEFHPPPPMPSTLTSVPRDLLADHLLLARSLAEQDGDRAILEALDFALYLVRRRLERTAH